MLTGAPRIVKQGFTQFDPFEDTESYITDRKRTAKGESFTQFDPFEDTERCLRFTWTPPSRRFTQFDPFEDTERISAFVVQWCQFVSPNSIRSRILKVVFCRLAFGVPAGFTQFDPFEDTERIAQS